MSFSKPEISGAEVLRLKHEWHQLAVRRRHMSGALKSVMTPILRRHGFTGSCPRFRRIKPERYDLFMFNFNNGHDSLVIEIGQCTPDWWRRPFSAYVPPEKLYPCLLPKHERAFILPRPQLLTAADCFQFGDAKALADYRRLAESFVPDTEKAIAMFDDFAHVEKLTEIFDWA